jgi:hypothetical protein
VALKLAPLIVAPTPFTLTLSGGVPLTVPVTEIGVFRVNRPFAGAAIEIVGGVARVTEIAAVPVFPAASVADALIGFDPTATDTVVVNAPELSVTGVSFTVNALIGLASVTVPVTVTGVPATSAPSAGPVIVTTGGVVSSVAETEADADPSALVAVAVSVFPPSTTGTEAL